MKRVRPNNGKKKSQGPLNIIKSPLSRKSSKQQTENDNLKLVLTFFAIVVSVLLFPRLGDYIRESAVSCPREPYDLRKAGTRLHFYTLRTLLTQTADDQYDANKLDCDNENGLCDEVEVTQAACVKECFSFSCGNDLQSWACQFYHDKRDKYKLQATQLDCTKVRGERACTPCRLTYSVTKKKVPCEFPNLCLEDRLKYLEQLSIPWNAYTKGILFLFILQAGISLVGSVFSSSSAKGASASGGGPVDVLLETFGLASPTKRRRPKKKKRRRRRSSSSSSAESRSSKESSGLDTEDELNRFFSDSSG